MELMNRIRDLRQEKRWTQEEMAEKIGVHQKQISAYERGINIPSTEVLIKLSEVFDVSLDYLAFEAEGRSAKVEIKDRELLRQFETIDKLNDQDKDIVKQVLNLVIMKNDFQSLLKNTHSTK